MDSAADRVLLRRVRVAIFACFSSSRTSDNTTSRYRL